jgi:formylglycine-generating enzyme required for sulfatase activity
LVEKLKQNIQASDFKPSRKKAALSISLNKGFVKVGCLLVLALWAAWFVLTAKSVGIFVSPSNSSITLHGWPTLKIGSYWLARPGPHQLEITADGYQKYERKLNVNETAYQKHKITLTPLPGNLNITTEPLKQGQAFVDGAFFGKIPGVIKEVPAGMRSIRLEVDRYLPFHVDLSIKGKGLEQAILAKLSPGWADIKINSLPRDAEIIVDGRDLGHTPLRAELLYGKREIELRLQGYKTWKKTWEIKAGRPSNLGEIVLAKADGEITINTIPEGATVSIDGQYKGVTPLLTAVSPEVKHKIDFMKEGFKPTSHTISVASADKSNVVLNLVPELASIRFETIPKDAQLMVDGALVGTATQTLTLPTHSHEFTIFRDGYATYQSMLTPRTGIEKKFRVRLKTAAAARREAEQNEQRKAKKGFVTTYVGQEMKLFSGGTVFLGSLKSEKNHQSNEVRRKVILEKPFYFSTKEVTIGEFRRFLATYSATEDIADLPNYDLHPVTSVSWMEAALYCNWLSRRDGLNRFYSINFGELLGVNPEASGYRLPTEAEWEWVAKDPENEKPPTFPWGSKYPPIATSGNYADISAKNSDIEFLTNYIDGYKFSAPVGTFNKSPKGIYDMGGNVSEWVNDYYSDLPSNATTYDSLGAHTGATKAIKGASWMSSKAKELRISFRRHGNNAQKATGFRLARYAR